MSAPTLDGTMFAIRALHDDAVARAGIATMVPEYNGAYPFTRDGFTLAELRNRLTLAGVAAIPALTGDWGVDCKAIRDKYVAAYP